MVLRKNSFINRPKHKCSYRKIIKAVEMNVAHKPLCNALCSIMYVWQVHEEFMDYFSQHTSSACLSNFLRTLTIWDQSSNLPSTFVCLCCIDRCWKLKYPILVGRHTNLHFACNKLKNRWSLLFPFNLRNRKVKPVKLQGVESIPTIKKNLGIKSLSIREKANRSFSRNIHAFL